MNTKIRYHHYHNGNDPINPETGLPFVRGTAIYATSAALVDLDTGNVIAEAWSDCSPRDVASRKKGREIAKGRLEKKLRLAEKVRVEIPTYVVEAMEKVSSVSHLI